MHALRQNNERRQSIVCVLLLFTILSQVTVVTAHPTPSQLTEAVTIKDYGFPALGAAENSLSLSEPQSDNINSIQAKTDNTSDKLPNSSHAKPRTLNRNNVDRSLKATDADPIKSQKHRHSKKPVKKIKQGSTSVEKQRK